MSCWLAGCPARVSCWTRLLEPLKNSNQVEQMAEVWFLVRNLAYSAAGFLKVACNGSREVGCGL
jgi:hypothetical protein